MDRWNEERKNKQAKVIYIWKPWEHSTGAQTPEGKEISKMNSLKHGRRRKEIRLLEEKIAFAKKPLVQINKLIKEIKREKHKK